VISDRVLKRKAFSGTAEVEGDIYDALYGKEKGQAQDEPSLAQSELAQPTSLNAERSSNPEGV
jgi:hypothetical protein